MKNPDQIYYLYIKEINQFFHNSLISQYWFQHDHSRFIPPIHKYYRLFDDDRNQFIKPYRKRTNLLNIARKQLNHKNTQVCNFIQRPDEYTLIKVVNKWFSISETKSNYNEIDFKNWFILNDERNNFLKQKGFYYND